MKVYFNALGEIKRVTHSLIAATSHNDVSIDAYSDFDPTGYAVSVTLLRADKVPLGPYEMTPVLKADGTVDYYKYLLEADDTAVMGALNATIRYEIYQYDADLGESIPTVVKACGMVTEYIQEAVTSTNSTILNLQHRLAEVEAALEDIILDVSGMDGFTASAGVEPVNPAENHVWFNFTRRN